LELAEVGAAFNTLSSRLLAWSGALYKGDPVFDPVVVALVWSVAIWIVSSWAGWGVRRLERPLLALAPAGTLLITTLAYTSRQITSLSSFLAITLLLLGFSSHQSRERRWKTKGIDYSRELGLEVGFIVVPITAVLVALAIVFPSISIWEIPSLVQNTFGGPGAQTKPVMDSLGLEPLPAQPVALSDLRSPGLPRGHLLGSGPELSQEVALLINTGQLPVDPTGARFLPPPPNYYWRSLTYDIYTGRGWRTSNTEEYTYEAGGVAGPTERPGWRPLRQQVEAVGKAGNLLYTAGELITADQTFNVNWRGPENPFAATVEVTTYRADSLVPLALTEEDLRGANVIYPEWVEEQGYLSLPEQLPERVLNLARDLTATAPTPYDRAKAIETYLRHFTYTLELPEPPVSRDMVDYFLFDLEQGYCDYYASAMVVLARAAGLPARLAVGYASGAYDPLTAKYIVTEAEAHSWPEIYFPEYGWIYFEPTAGRREIDRSSGAAEADRAEAASTPLEPLAPPPQLQGRAGLFLWGGTLLLLLAGVGWFLLDGWRLRRLAPVATIGAVYERLGDHGQRLAVPRWMGDTPYEFATSLSRRLERLAQGRWRKILRPAALEVRSLTDLYVQTAYSPQAPGLDDQQQMIQVWQRLRGRLWLAWLVTLFQKSKRLR
jgi:transglutaminase-like putative cysteine protease